MDDSLGQGTFHEQDIQKGEVPDGARFCFVLEKLDAKSFKFAKPIHVMSNYSYFKAFRFVPLFLSLPLNSATLSHFSNFPSQIFNFLLL